MKEEYTIMNSIIKNIIKSILLCIYIFLLIFVIANPSTKGKEFTVMPLNNERTLTLEKDMELVQTFFPLKNNITSIALHFVTNGTNTINIRIFDNETGDDYYENDLIINNDSEKKLSFPNTVKGYQNRELYIRITPIKLSNDNPLQIVLTDEIYRDNHLLINGVEVRNDIALSIDYSNELSNKGLIMVVCFMILTFFALYVSKNSRNKVSRETATYIDFIRVLAALSVLLVHLGDAVPFSDSIYQYTRYGAHGVEIFYAISGFFIFLSIQKNNNLKDFYMKRLSKIVPVYYAMLLIIWGYFTFFEIQVPTDSSSLYWWRYILFLSTSIPTNSEFWINLCATWTVSAFVCFYLLAPLLYKVVNTFWKSIVFVYLSYILGETVIMSVLRNVFISINWDTAVLDHNPFRYLWLFAFGISAFFAVKEKKEKTFITLLMVILLFRFINLLEHSRIEYTVIISVMLVIAYNENIINKKLRKFVLLLNPYTYCLYIVHPIVLLVFGNTIEYFDNRIQYSALLIIIIAILTYIMHHLVEVPMGKLLSHVL